MCFAEKGLRDLNTQNMLFQKKLEEILIKNPLLNILGSAIDGD